MPCINVKVNIPLDDPKREAVKSRLGKAIELVPGKSERWLMIVFEDQRAMYFQGKKDSPMAFCEVKIFGKANKSIYEKLTGEITGTLSEELGISPDKIYIKYEEVAYWGWNGSNL